MNFATQRFGEPNPACHINPHYYYWYDTYIDVDSSWDGTFQQCWLYGPAPKSWVIYWDHCPVLGIREYHTPR